VVFPFNGVREFLKAGRAGRNA